MSTIALAPHQASQQNSRQSSATLPGIYEKTIFSPERRRVTSSHFIKAMHPKTEISPSRAAIERVLRSGWAGQMKIHGHRAQIHLPADARIQALVFNRLGRLHARPLDGAITRELRRIFNPKKGWTVIDGEWLKLETKLFVFDLLKKDDALLRDQSYAQRFAMLPKLFISPHVQVLPLLNTVDQCLGVFDDPNPLIEGLVFRALNSAGFADSAIIRCRKRSSS